MVAALLPEKKNHFKIYAVLALVLILVSAFFVFFFLNAVLTRFNENGPGNLMPIPVTHWAGYMIALDTTNSSEGASSISASWIVPTVAYSQKDTLSSVWIGIGGYGEKTLIQAGTEQQCVNGKIEYFAWYELLPEYIVRTDSVNVNPGDKITVTITLLNPNQDIWQITIYDATNGSHFEKSDIIYDSSQKSAEWVVERPTVNNQISTLSNFGSATVMNCTTTINGLTGSIKDFTYQPISMVDLGGSKLTSTSALSSDGSSFTVTYINQTVNATTIASSSM